MKWLIFFNNTKWRVLLFWSRAWLDVMVFFCNHMSSFQRLNNVAVINFCGYWHSDANPFRKIKVSWKVEWNWYHPIHKILVKLFLSSGSWVGGFYVYVYSLKCIYFISVMILIHHGGIIWWWKLINFILMRVFCLFANHKILALILIP